MGSKEQTTQHWFSYF